MVPRAPSGEKTAPSVTSGSTGGTMFIVAPPAPFLAPAALAGDFAGDFVPFFGDCKLKWSIIFYWTASFLFMVLRFSDKIHGQTTTLFLSA